MARRAEPERSVVGRAVPEGLRAFRPGPPAPVTGDDHVLGPGDAPVTLVEYGDYEWGERRSRETIMSDRDEELRTRIRDVEKTLDHLRGELGERTDDPRDYGDSGQDLMVREEQAAQIEALESERRRLLEQLGES